MRPAPPSSAPWLHVLALSQVRSQNTLSGGLLSIARCDLRLRPVQRRTKSSGIAMCSIRVAMFVSLHVRRLLHADFGCHTLMPGCQSAS